MEAGWDSYCSMCMDVEEGRAMNCNHRSFVTDARRRLDSLKSSYNSPLPRCVIAGMWDKYKDSSSSEESVVEESALDAVELLDIEDDAQDEENWLYQSPKMAVDDRSQSALRWCRHVLDNPSPATEAACRSLINKLQQSSSRHFYRCPAVFHLTGNASLDSCTDQVTVNTTHSNSDSIDHTGPSTSSDSTSWSFRLQDITDIHIAALIQEAALRHDYVSMPVSGRGAVPPPGLSSLNSPPGQSSSSVATHGYTSPKLSRLQQQVTQFKLLKRAQSQGASADRTRSPLRTSLRSLQAVRNSRSFETDDYPPADSQITFPMSGKSYGRRGSSCRFPLLSAASLEYSVRDSSDRMAAVRRLHRSQSASPCRIPNPAKGRLLDHGRVFASPERSTAIAWARGVPCSQR